MREAPPAPALPRRDRVAILTALAGLTLVCWAYLVWMAIGMTQMDMSQMDMSRLDMSMAMQVKPWTVVDFALMFAMWVIMMIGMMVPSATPMALIYAAVARKAQREGHTLPSTAFFVSGYVAIWTLFSLAATLAQWGLDRAALLSPMMVTTSPLAGGAILIAAGIYQLTPAKQACLEHCRAPAHFISTHWRNGGLGAFKMGVEHGAYCLGCCWLIMGLLFFGGVMNLLWIFGITLFVLLEKVVPAGPAAGRLAGIALIALGGAVLVYAA
jgi:predicted metal-binding membrane protein